MNETVGDIFSIFEDFTYNGVILNIIKILDTIWFRAKDITMVLGYKNTANAVLRHVDDEDKKEFVDLRVPETRTSDSCVKNKQKSGVTETGTPDFGVKNTQNQTLYLNESGMYTLIFASKLPTAKAFTRWVTSEVIPSIRRTGEYINQELINRVQKLELENQTQRDTIKEKDDVIQEKTVENKEQHDTINKKDETINIKSKVVVPPTTNSRYDTYFLLIEISKDYKYAEGDPEHYKESQYITIRCQKKAITTLLARVQKAGNESNNKVRIVCMFLNPNAINYALRLKKEYGNLIKCKYTGITTSLPESELKEIIYKVNGEKYPYGVKS